MPATTEKAIRAHGGAWVCPRSHHQRRCGAPVASQTANGASPPPAVCAVVHGLATPSDFRRSGIGTRETASRQAPLRPTCSERPQRGNGRFRRDLKQASRPARVASALPAATRYRALICVYSMRRLRTSFQYRRNDRSPAKSDTSARSEPLARALPCTVIMLSFDISINR